MVEWSADDDHRQSGGGVALALARDLVILVNLQIGLAWLRYRCCFPSVDETGAATGYS